MQLLSYLVWLTIQKLPALTLSEGSTVAFGTAINVLY